ncbi:MAG TPA: alpha/beta hydrolase, partial [Candidatus Limnocylindrales bacterium]
LADPRPLDVGIHVADVIAYLDARGIDRADLVGVSFGGVVALETAARHPARVASVTAYEPPYGPVAVATPGAAIPDVVGRIETAYARSGAAGAAETFMRAVAGDAAWDALPRRTRTFLEQEGVSALADGSLLGLEPDGLGGIAAPVLLLTGGASDAFYAPIADELGRRIPVARRATLDGLAHPAPINRPNAVADAIRAFLESTPE